MKSLESYQTAHAGLFKTETCLSIITRLAMISDSRPLQALWTNAGRLATDGCAPSPFLSRDTDICQNIPTLLY